MPESPSYSTAPAAPAGLGHIPQMEAPDRWLATVESWLDRAWLKAAEKGVSEPA